VLFPKSTNESFKIKIMQLNQKTNGLILANGSKELFDNIDTAKVKVVVMVMVNSDAKWK